MITWRDRSFLAVLLVVVGFYSAPADCQQPQRRPRDRIIAAQDNIPTTSFTCANKTSGYYADIETGCQVYHMCEGGRQFSYRCPNTTLFQQRMLICAHWYQVNCSRSEQHYSANLLIGQRDKPFVEDGDYISVYYNGKDVKTLNNPDDLQNLNNANVANNNKNRVPVFHSNKDKPVIPNTQLKVLSTLATPVQSVFTNTNPSFNFQSSNQKIVPTQTSFLNSNQNVNAQVFNQNFKIHSTSPPTKFINSNPSVNAQFVHQNFKPQPAPTQTTFTNANPNFNFQSSNKNFNVQPSNQNFKPQAEQTQITFTNSNFNAQLSNSNFKPFVSHSTANTPSSFQTRTTFAPFTKQVTTTETPQIQIEQKTLRPQPFPDQSSNTPVIQTNEFNNFIKRFNPDFITEAIIPDKENKNNDKLYSQYNNFIKRFNPDESSHDNTAINKINQSVASFVNSNVYSNRNFESHNLEPPVQQPSSDFEVPVGDADQMESNNLELHFQDPRQVFFIPESDSQIIAAESATPLTVNIPRSVGQQFHPMLFVNSVRDECFRCHPPFIVNKATCTPCVVIR